MYLALNAKDLANRVSGHCDRSEKGQFRTYAAAALVEATRHGLAGAIRGHRTTWNFADRDLAVPRYRL